MSPIDPRQEKRRVSIRIRFRQGQTIALCAAETDAEPGDIYLDDACHYALAAKFAQDWQGRTVDWQYPGMWKVMASQKLRDAKEELDKWLKDQERSSVHVRNLGGLL
jgi:hypothetical protein